MEFNEEQIKVINYEGKSLLVEAGPGSGKTTVIIERIKFFINKGINPESLLVITFTRKAADNLKKKLKQFFTNDIIDEMQISTIHSFCLEYLKTKNQTLKLLDDDTSEKKDLFIQKYKKRLGFTNEFTVYDYQIPSVIKKYGEYTCFNVNTPELVEYITQNYPISQEYIDLIGDLNYFSKKRVEDNDFKDDWYNARFLQIARSYPVYLKLLDEFNYVDYDTLQLKTLNELEKDQNTKYKCILVDEFQDTDPLQFKIFEILHNACDYFTAVGDVDQHIYAFRSSYKDYFDEMAKKSEIISLNKNYRSTENIVNLTDEYIKHQRKDYSQKHLESANNKYNNDSFLIKSETPPKRSGKYFQYY